MAGRATAGADKTTDDESVASDLAALARTPRRAVSWAMALVVVTLAGTQRSVLLIDTAIVYLLFSPMFWHTYAVRRRVGIAAAELLITPAVLIAMQCSAPVIAAAAQGLLLVRLAMHGSNRLGVVVLALLAGVLLGTAVGWWFTPQPLSALTLAAPWWTTGLAGLWFIALVYGVALLSFRQSHRLEDARRRAAARSRALALLARRLGRYLAPQVHASLFAELSGTSGVSHHRRSEDWRRSNGAAVAQAEAAMDMASRRAPRRRWLTVFFSDIAGFTTLTEALEPEEVARLLNDYLDAMTAIALAYGGTVDKFIGDGMMVFYGDPDSRGRVADALACVRMATAMQAKVAELAAHWADAGAPAALRVRMGVASGVCTVGDFGAEHRLDYTALGRTVNLASRLETAAPPGGVLISAATAALTRECVPCHALERLPLPGIAQPVAPFIVLCAEPPTTLLSRA